MLPWIIQISVISLILIVLVHYLFTFFKTNLTIPKVKDLVNKPIKQYEELFDTMKETNIVVETPKISMESNENMKNELKNYLKELSSGKEKAVPSDVLPVDNLVPLSNLSGENPPGNHFSGSYSTF